MGVGPAADLDPVWQIEYSPPTPPLFFSYSTQMLQLCTAPTDQNLIPGYWPQTSHPLLTVPISEGQIQPRNRLILRGVGFWEMEDFVCLCQSARELGDSGRPLLQDPVLSTRLFLLLPQVTLPEHLFSCCSV